MKEVLRRIRGLWRFDGDEEPVLISRRAFLFLGGVAAAGALVPPALVSPAEAFLARQPNPLKGLLDADVVAAYIEKVRASGALQRFFDAEHQPLFLDGLPLMEARGCPRIEFWRGRQ